MSAWSEVRARLDALLHGQRRDRESEEEIAFHLQMQAQQLEHRGMPAPEAARQARLAFGGVADTRERIREARGTALLDQLVADVSYTFRQMRRAPGFTLTVVTVLALGIGASAAIYSVVDRVLFRPLPFVDPSRLVVVWETDRRSGTTREPASWPDIVDFQDRAKSLTSSTALYGADMSLTSTNAPPIRLTGIVTTASFFSMTGTRPVLGRAFLENETKVGGPRVAMLGESVWRARFAGDREILGRTIRVDDVAYQVIGVVPNGTDVGIDQVHELAAYHAPYTGEGEAGVWLPLQASADEFPRATHPLFFIGRLAPGAAVATAQAELAGIASDLEQTYRNENAERGVHVEALPEVVFGPSRPLLYLLLSAVGLLLLVALANVANLMLARGASRGREIAIRNALGATAPRVGRQLLVESLVLGVTGGAVGVIAAGVILKALLAQAPANIPRIGEVSVDGRVILLSLAATLVVGLACGLVPMWQARRLAIVPALKADAAAPNAAAARWSSRELLVVAAVALAVTLSIGANMLTRSFRNLMDADPGFQASQIVKAEYQLPLSRYPRDMAKWPKIPEIQQFNALLLQRAQGIAGVQSVALAAAHPLDAGFTNSWAIVGREGEAKDFPEISVRAVSPTYIETVGGKLVRGRQLSAADDGDAPATALINETTAKRFFPTTEALGAQIRFWGTSRTIVGIVHDERIHGLRASVPPAIYVPLAQVPSNSGVLLVRTTANTDVIGRELQRAISSVDPQLAVYGVESFGRTVLRSVSSNRFAMLVLSIFALTTALLALIGVHGVVRYLATQRTREIGIRVALGARRWEVIGLMVRSGVGLATVGIAVGVGGAWALSRLLRTLLYGVGTTDALSFIGVAVLMFVATAASAYLPARRAARTSPLIAIRGS
ncbi:MAG: ABC transporter permease [Gemmatimonadaceae bacterium]